MGQLKLSDEQLNELHLIVEASPYPSVSPCLALTCIIAQLGKNLDPRHIQIYLWQIAQQYDLRNLFAKAVGDTAKLIASIEDLKSLSNMVYRLNREQSVHIFPLSLCVAGPRDDC